MVKQVSIRDDGYHDVIILLDGKDVTQGCAGYTIERNVDGLPVLTLRYIATNVEIDAVCEVRDANA